MTVYAVWVCGGYELYRLYSTEEKANEAGREYVLRNGGNFEVRPEFIY